MHIKSIKVQNFRNIPSSFIEFSPSSNAIIGRNGNGKSNILKAIDLVLSNKEISQEERKDLILNKNLTLKLSVEILFENISEFLKKNLNIKENNFYLKREISVSADELFLNSSKISKERLSSYFLLENFLSPNFFVKQNTVSNIVKDNMFDFLKKSCNIDLCEKIINDSQILFEENEEEFMQIKNNFKILHKKLEKSSIHKQNYENYKSLSLESKNLENILLKREMDDLKSTLSNITSKTNTILNLTEDEIYSKIEFLEERRKICKRELAILGIQNIEKESELNKEIQKNENLVSNLESEFSRIKTLKKNYDERILRLKIQQKAFIIFSNKNKNKSMNKNYENLDPQTKKAEIRKVEEEIKSLKSATKFVAKKDVNLLIEERKKFWRLESKIKEELKETTMLEKRLKFNLNLFQKSLLTENSNIIKNPMFLFEILKIPAEMIKAVESALGNLLYCLVVKTHEEAYEIFSLAKKFIIPKKVNVICIDAIKTKPKTYLKDEDVIKLSSLIEVSPEYETLKQSLLNNFFLVSDLNIGINVFDRFSNNLIKKENFKNLNLKNFQIVTLSGEKLKIGQIIGANKTSNFSKLTSLKIKISEFEQKYEKLQLNIQKITEDINHSVDPSDDVNVKIAVLENKVQMLKGIEPVDVSDVMQSIEEELKNLCKDLGKLHKESNIESDKLSKLKYEHSSILTYINLEKERKETEKELKSLKYSINYNTNDLISTKIDLEKECNILKKERIEEKIDLIKQKLGNLKISIVNKTNQEIELELNNLKEEVRKYSIIDPLNILNTKNSNAKNFKNNYVINMEIVRKHESIQKNYSEGKENLLKLKNAKQNIEKILENLQKRKTSMFKEFIEKFNKNVQKIKNLINFEIKANITENNFEITNLYELSGGQRSLLSLLILVCAQNASSSDIYMFDEVDAAIDPKNREIFRNAAKILNGGDKFDSQVFVVSFNSDSILSCDKIFKVNNDKDVGNGNIIVAEVGKEEALEFLK